MGKIETRKKLKRRAILDAACDVFLVEGYVTASMDRIAAAAGVTKQTVYRYFSSKEELFGEALKHMREAGEEEFETHLTNPDTRAALLDYAVGFIRAHLSDSHLEVYRLLIAEGGKSPELTRTFFSVGPEDTDRELTAFFRQRLGVDHPETAIRLWTAMLLAPRNEVLIGLPAPSVRQVEDHARMSLDVLVTGMGLEVR
ncbi:MAG: TetR family transcriptional regulator [Rhodobacteraceae bacterium]|nr:TetR family transcriptional regulator [Paracoccaceae bacterium]